METFLEALFSFVAGESLAPMLVLLAVLLVACVVFRPPPKRRRTDKP